MPRMISCADRPCATCPYRLDVPSGIWDASEYGKLPLYDGDMAQQALAGAVNLFDCHHQPGSALCAGWVGTHSPGNLLALRIHAARVDPEIHAFRSPVPLFASGAAAAAHGIRDIRSPGKEALAAIAKVTRSRAQSAASLITGS